MDIRNKQTLALALAILALALIGQFFFVNIQANLRDGVIFFAIAVILFIWMVRRERGVEGTLNRAVSWISGYLRLARENPVRTVMFVIGIALAYTTLRLLKAKPGYESYWDVFAMWIASWLIYILAFSKIPRFSAFKPWFNRHKIEIALVSGLTLAAILLRMIGLGSIPNVIGGDEGRIGLLAISVQKGELNNMLATIFGHSTLYIYAMAGAMKIFGNNPFGLRFASAFAGALTVPALYFLARYMFNRRIATIAASLLAVSHFHLHFSRIIVAGSIQDAFFATVAFYLLYSGLKERNSLRLAGSGIVVGVHLYIYMGARLVILLVPVYILILFFVNRRMVTENIANLLAFVGALGITSAPMVLWAIEHWAEFNARANQIGVIQSGWLENEAVLLGTTQFRLFLDLFADAFLTVNFFPAKAFYNGSLPMLDYISGAIFILGIAYSLYRVLEPKHLLLHGWFWSGILVGGAMIVLSGDAAYRVMIVFPAVCLFVAIGWVKLIEFFARAFPWKERTQYVLIGIFMIGFTIPNIKAYFVDYATTCRYEDWATRFASHMGRYMAELDEDTHTYVLGFPRIYYGIHGSVDFFKGDRLITNINDPLMEPPTMIDADSSAVFVFIPEREAELEYVTQVFPNGTLEQIDDCGEKMLVIYNAEKGDQ